MGKPVTETEKAIIPLTTQGRCGDRVTRSRKRGWGDGEGASSWMSPILVLVSSERMDRAGRERVDQHR